MLLELLEDGLMVVFIIGMVDGVSRTLPTSIILCVIFGLGLMLLGANV